MDDDLIWKALSDPSRRRIIELLHAQPRRTGDLAACFDVTRFAVMKHLDLLVEAGLVTVERRGRERWNRLALERLTPTVAGWLAQFAVGAEAEQGNLPGAVEAMAIEAAVEIDLPRRRAYQLFVEQAENWWPREGEGRVRLEAATGGWLYLDRGPGRPQMIWAVIGDARAPAAIELIGACGQKGVESARTRLVFEKAGKGRTVVHLRTDALVTLDQAGRERYRAFWRRLLTDAYASYADTQAGPAEADLDLEDDDAHGEPQSAWVAGAIR
ncbi:MAG: ArsR family transcriptional regulator [Tistrella sp.]|jgi:DNA-binding transcriptional ArsR family regulator|uniref:Transcriptional regulator, ArsR family n=2 Tax=Tistrella mobilis TaxID=171437 RepID=I3THB8_TISMK|nr:MULTISPECIES: metalloregulator ArsR/SmtB family transcription factor [Tistrella]AFK52156.1 transcriptional regulator, ArsR family [Tistrella mobilis KA081020-065]MAD39385.1 ArsR family transcriptional regulator [Tistrella sp.]MAM73970.1 ArsR family transcriptional regulator [Tistrella sp.]MBA76401.1 ArsR family transcriptional regulator [Tistrella sp.]HAE48501.1 ArsR family transcriptional regulator [Tistrella mobilis]